MQLWRRLAQAVAIATISLLANAGVAENDALAALESAQQQIFSQAAASVVFISTPSGFGSGFAVAPRLLLTSGHVVAGVETVTVVHSDGTKARANVVERATHDVDLALLELPADGPAMTPLAIASTHGMRIGSWAAAIGHGAGGSWTFTTGMVTNVYETKGGRDVIQTQVPINPGCSGGPLLDRHGRPIGVTTAILREAQNVAFALRMELALRALPRLASVCASCLTVEAPANVEIFVDGKAAGVGRVVLFATPRAYALMAVIDGKMVRREVVFPRVRHAQLLPK